MPDFDLRVLDDLSGIAAADWNRLAGGNPMLSHQFFHALHQTGCAAAASGWLPQFLTLWDQSPPANASAIPRLRAAMPLYLKSHSYGEYVFDWAWADAYRRHGLEYYPKLLAAIPFSPVSGPRLLAATDAERAALLRAALALAQNVSSLHVLFPQPQEALLMQEAGMMLRSGVQFHWNNQGYGSFEDFLAQLSHAKRKKIRQERRKVRDAGATFRRLRGDEIRDSDWAFFTRCYNRTYREHHSTPYLTLEFFQRLGQTMPQHVLLIVAELEGKPIASALNLYSKEALYGRYWGALQYLPCLHFETCYYQALEFCIEDKIKLFEGGAQGEHKLARGFLPVKTLSAHWLAHPEFSDAVERFLEREHRGIENYVDELNEHSPYKGKALPET
ncbi:MAG TPA: GNAT family N-acetyltransferase [Burkholderiales bacterium]|nr:GNAT family N-acetyltransferase [Burkholderiales bacterium]